MPVRPIRSLTFCVPFMQQFHRSGRVDGKRPSYLKTIIQAVLEKLPSSPPPPPTPPPPNSSIVCLQQSYVANWTNNVLLIRAVYIRAVYIRLDWRLAGSAGRGYICFLTGHRGDTNCSVFLIGIQRTPFHQCQAFT